jgi:hypothetical protein
VLEVDESARPSAPDDDERPGTAPPGPGSERLFLASVGLALLPIAVAVARAAARGWLPIGDNAYFAIRAADTLTEHHPLLGTWTSASLDSGTNFNNPGPLLFQLLALPTKLLGSGIGVAVGAALLNGLAVVGIAVVARRRGGPLVGVASMAVVALLCWTMGSELLFDPWQPNSLLLTFLFGLVLVWSVVCGDVRLLPWAVGVTSLIVQTHLSYAVLLVALSGWGLVGLALFLRRQRRAGSPTWDPLRRAAVRSAGWSMVVAAACWSQPVLEQLTGEGEGNLSRLAANMAVSEGRVGVRLGTRIVADVLVPPFWLRPSYGEALERDPVVAPGADPLTSLDPGFGLAAALLVGLVAVLLVVGLDARRRGDRTSAAAVSTALVAGAAGLVTAWNLPFGFFGVSAHQFRWLWPVAAFVTLALVTALVRRTSAPGSSGRAVLVLTVVTAVVAVANLPTNNQRTGPSRDDWAIPVVRELNRQMAALEDEGTLLLDPEGTQFAEPFTGPVMAELQRRGIPFVVEDEVLVRQLGTARRVSGDAQRLQVLQGPTALVAPPGSRRVALVEGLTAEEQDELDELEGLLAGHLQGTAPRITPEGGAALERPEHVAGLAAVRAGDAEAIVASHVLVFLVDHELIEVDEDWAPRFDRYADLQRRADRDTVALYLKPLDA